MGFITWLDRRRKEKEIEQLLPLAIYAAYADGLAGVSPLKLLEFLSSGFGELSKETRRVVLLSQRGMPLKLAVKKVETKSVFFKEFLNELTALEQGIGDGESLRKLADKVLSTQRALLKSHSSKSNLTGLFLVASGAVAPALFASISLLGPVIGFAIGPMEVFVMFLAVFPLLNALLLTYASYTSPSVMS